ncbi:MAG: CPBP family intramembrane glutamic endopeptidase [Anaerolineae bacterium]|nr:CPBP family intramembrane metalloprotease [Candidatus Roseilinea sp.]MDW8450889.1 CPBP family intramembrane glutamic endopeptidase [Anaerolineae bacterium]
MDSVGQSSVATTSAKSEGTQPVELPAAKTTALDLSVRAMLFAAFVGTLIRQIGMPSLNGALYPLMVYSLPAAAYLLASTPAVASTLRRYAESQPLGMALLALAPLVPVAAYARAAFDFDPAELLFGAVLIFLPAACAILNVPQLHRADVLLGLITVAVPLLLPYAPDSGVGAPSEPPTTFGIVMRFGAFLLPVALLVFTTREQKQRLNFLFVCAALSLWYAAQFRALPDLPIAGDVGVTYFQLAIIPIFLYVLATAGRFDRLGMSFQPTPRGVSVVTANLALLAAIGVPVGMVTGALVPAFQGPPPLDAAAQALSIFLLIALPQEILFRGVLLTYLQDVLRLNAGIAAIISAVLFGAAHLSGPADLGWPFILAVLTGVFCARAFLATRNVVAAGVVHTFARWVKWLLFGG